LRAVLDQVARDVERPAGAAVVAEPEVLADLHAEPDRLAADGHLERLQQRVDGNVEVDGEVDQREEIPFVVELPVVRQQALDRDASRRRARAGERAAVVEGVAGVVLADPSVLVHAVLVDVDVAVDHDDPLGEPPDPLVLGDQLLAPGVLEPPIAEQVPADAHLREGHEAAAAIPRFADQRRHRGHVALGPARQDPHLGQRHAHRRCLLDIR